MNAREQHIAIHRSARLSVIGDADHASDLWIACHGYGQLASRFIRDFEIIASSGRVIVAPEGLHRFYMDPPPAPAGQRRVGATWMTREDRDADIADYVAYLDQVARNFTASQAARVRALGFSQGCATVFRWAVFGTTRIDELILWGGETPPDMDMQQASTALAGTRIVLVQGAIDKMAPKSQLQRHTARLEAAGLGYDLYEHGGGHHLDPTLLAAIAARN